MSGQRRAGRSGATCRTPAYDSGFPVSDPSDTGHVTVGLMPYCANHCHGPVRVLGRYPTDRIHGRFPKRTGQTSPLIRVPLLSCQVLPCRAQQSSETSGPHPVRGGVTRYLRRACPPGIRRVGYRAGPIRTRETRPCTREWRDPTPKSCRSRRCSRPHRTASPATWQAWGRRRWRVVP